MLTAPLADRLVTAAAIATAPRVAWSGWRPDAAPALTMAASAIVYAAGVRRAHRRAGPGRAINRRQIWCFALGMLTLAIALASPLDALAEGLFSAHMVQHLLLMAVAPPLLVAGAPALAAFWTLSPRARRALVAAVRRARWPQTTWRAVTLPAVAWLLHTVAVWSWHAPALYQRALTSDVVHAAEHLSLLGTGMLLWWSILHPRGARRLGYAVGIVTLFATAMQTGVLGALLTLSHRVWYPAQATAVAAWGLTPLQDQQLAGLIMWVVGGLIYVVAMSVLFVAWLTPARTGRIARTAALGALAPLAGCATPLSTFAAGSDTTAGVAHLTVFMLVLSAAMCLLVFGLLAAAAYRNRRRSPHEVDLSEPGAGWIIWGGAVMPIIVLTAIFVVAESAMGHVPSARPALTIRVTGHQWWWQLDYEFPNGTAAFRSANELHVPAGQAVRLLLTSADVIHSFWVPRLAGKLDVIPGDTNDLRITALQPGVYQGACAEYCGMQHAHMGITVVADDSATFAQWTADQLADGAAPADSLAREGQHLFVSGVCASCHTVRGTTAMAAIGPDLTHVGSRQTIAAGTRPNSLGNLEGWIANPQAIKPGTLMPTLNQFDGDQLRALAAYVASLK